MINTRSADSGEFAQLVVLVTRMSAEVKDIVLEIATEDGWFAGRDAHGFEQFWQQF